MPSILIVSAYFAPSRRIGARRAEKIAEHLGRAGWNVTVLTMHAESVPPIDMSLSVPANVEVVRTSAFLPRVTLSNLGKILRPIDRAKTTGTQTLRNCDTNPATLSKIISHVIQNGKNAINRVLRPIELLDEFDGWRHFALRAVRNRRFDVVLGTLPPFTAAWIAFEVARRCGAQLVLDYRDPWCDLLFTLTSAKYSRRALNRHRRVEQLCIDRSALILGVSPTICRWLRARTSTPVELIPQGVEPIVSSGNDPSEVPARLVYAGALSYGRALRPVFEAIAQIKESIPPDKLRLVYCGPDGVAAQSDAREVGVSEYVDNLGEISVKQAREALLNAAAGVVIVSKGYEYAYPGKIFDILGARRHILLIGAESSDAADLVRRHQCGWCHSEFDVTGIANSIREAIRGVRVEPIGLDEMNVTTLMTKLSGLLYGVIRTKQTGADRISEI